MKELDVETSSTTCTQAKVEAARILDSAESKSWTDVAKAKTAQLRERATNETMQLKSTLEAFVRREPTKALLGAAGIGGLLGILFKRAR